jgi:hypothetical protein
MRVTHIENSSNNDTIDRIEKRFLGRKSCCVIELMAASIAVFFIRQNTEANNELHINQKVFISP